jgi:hypothetical protein
MDDAVPSRRGRPPRALPSPRALPNLHLAEVRSADAGWRRVVEALDRSEISLDEALGYIRIVKERLPLVDAEELRRDLALVQARQAQARLTGRAAKLTVDVTGPAPEGA